MVIAGAQQREEQTGGEATFEAPCERFTSTLVNRRWEPFPHRMDATSHAALQELLRFCNGIGGPVRNVFTFMAPPGVLHSNVGTVAFSDLDRLLRHLAQTPSLDPGTRGAINAGGKGFGLFEMLVSSIGEGIERVVGSLSQYVAPSRGQLASRCELVRQGRRCLGPGDVPMFTAEQYADPGFLYEPFTDDSLLEWIPGRHLLSGLEVWVPAQLVRMVHLAPPGEALIGYSGSGGLSSHVSRELAIYHGVREIVERDALNLRWYLRLPPGAVGVDGPIRSARLRTLLADVSHRPAPVMLLSHALDIPEIPVMTAVHLAPWLRAYAWCAGAGADLDVETSLLEALNEYGQSERIIECAVRAPERVLAHVFRQEFGLRPEASLSEMTTYVKALGFYGHEQTRGLLRWYLDGAVATSLSELEAQQEPAVPGERPLDRLCRVLERHGLDPIVFDFTPAGLRQLALIRMFEPRLTQPFLQSRPMLGHPRFATIAHRYGSPVNAPSPEPPLPYP